VSEEIGLEETLTDMINGLAAYSTHIVGGLILVIMIGAGVIGMSHYSKTQEKEAFAQLYALEKVYHQAQEEIRNSLKEGEQVQYTEAMFNEHFASVAQSIREFVKANAGRSASVVAAMDLGELYTSFEKHEEAASMLSELAPQVDASTLTGALFFVQMGRSYINVEKYTEAQEALNKVVNNAEMKFLHPVALLNLGLSYYKEKNTDKAHELFTRISDEFSDTEPGRSAAVYLRLLKSNEG
tara:strand:- start:25564 stop:26283 length:720 start_codon:yes stop_codon:yes gene_type:complete